MTNLNKQYSEAGRLRGQLCPRSSRTGALSEGIEGRPACSPSSQQSNRSRTFGWICWAEEQENLFHLHK